MNLTRLFAGQPNPQARALLVHICTQPGVAIPDSFLQECLTADCLAWLTNAVERTMLGGLLWAALSDDQKLLLPPDLRQRLADLHLGNAFRWETHRRLIALYLPPLAEVGINVVLLKGAPLVLTVYQDPGERAMTDLDLLISEDRLMQAHHLLASAAAQVKPSIRGHRHLGAILLPGAAGMLELHGAQTHLDAWPQTKDLLTEGVVINLEGVTVRLPDLVNLWLHVACHSLVHDPDCWPRMAADLARIQASPEWTETAWSQIWTAAVHTRRRRAVLMAAAMAAAATVPAALQQAGATSTEIAEAEARARLGWRAAWELSAGRWGPWARLWSLDPGEQTQALRRHALPRTTVLADATGLPIPLALATYPLYVLWRCYSLASTGMAWRRALRACLPPGGVS